MEKECISKPEEKEAVKWDSPGREVEPKNAI